MIVGTLPAELGRYRLTRRIGSGAMGVVYEGEDPVIGRPIAVKVMRVDMLDGVADNGYRDRFRQEVRAAGRCVHPGIVTIFDYAEQEGVPFIVMELVHGEQLQNFIGTSPMPVAEAASLALQMLAALEHAHGRGVVHRDIKPSNIIVSAGATGRGGAAGPQVKITDFGIARVTASAMTDAGLLLGTPSYISPERARGEPTDARADLYAVGVVLFRMVMGTLPYGDADVAAVLHRTAGPEPVDLRALDARAPNLTPVMASALAKDPRERFASAAAFADALREMAQDRSREELWPLTPAEVAVAAGGDPALARLRPDSRAEGGWSPELLRELREALGEAIGPIAGFLLPRVAATCHDGAALVENLARTVDDAAARARFHARATAIALRAVGTPAAESGSSSAGRVPGPAARTGGASLHGSQPRLAPETPARAAEGAPAGPRPGTLSRLGSLLRAGSLGGVAGRASPPPGQPPGPPPEPSPGSLSGSPLPPPAGPPPAAPEAPPAPMAAPTPEQSPEVLAAAQTLLARYIGPIARVVVRQSAPGLGSFEELGERLGGHIRLPAERDAFRRDFAALLRERLPGTPASGD